MISQLDDIAVNEISRAKFDGGESRQISHRNRDDALIIALTAEPQMRGPVILVALTGLRDTCVIALRALGQRF